MAGVGSVPWSCGSVVFVSVGVLITSRGGTRVPRSDVCLPIRMKEILCPSERFKCRSSTRNSGVSVGGPCCYRLATLC